MRCLQTYKYPPAPACQGPPGCEENDFNTQSSVPFNIPSASEVSAIWCPAGQQSGSILYPLDQQFTLNHVRGLNSGWSWKSMKFQWVSNTRKNHQNGLPRPSKVTKMRFQELPEVIKITKIVKKWNLMKTHVFTILWRGWNIIIHKIFLLKIIKMRACYPSKLLRTSNHRKCQKVIQNGRQRGTQNPSKIVKSQSWDPPGLLWVHLYSTLTQKWFPRIPRWPKMVIWWI